MIKFALCPICDREYTKCEIIQACPDCGLKLIRECPRCKSDIIFPNKKYCAKCGFKLKD